jgi:lysophospholipase L1-like esterase
VRYVALGDSITAGGPSGVSYVDRYGDYINKDLRVAVTSTKLGVPGVTSAGLLQRLRDDQDFQNALKDADIVTLMIGVNDYAVGRAMYYKDICGGPACSAWFEIFVRNFRFNLTKIVSEIRGIDRKPGVAILLADLYNPSIRDDMDSASQAVLLPFFNQMNATIHAIATSNGLQVAGVYQAFNGPDGLQDPIAKGYLRDGVHPSDEGHQVIAAQFRKLDGFLIR